MRFNWIPHRRWFRFSFVGGEMAEKPGWREPPSAFHRNHHFGERRWLAKDFKNGFATKRCSDFPFLHAVSIGLTGPQKIGRQADQCARQPSFHWLCAIFT
jgi:hypothetical protein